MLDFTNLIAQAHQDGGSSVLQLVDKLARTPLSQVVIVMAIVTALRVLLFPKLVNTPPHLRSGSYGVAKFANEFFDAVVYAGVFVFLVIRPFVIQTFYIPSASMVQTLQINDFIVANKWVYRFSEPKRGDVVVFRPPAYALQPGQSEDTDFIKRVIGLPGDLIEIKDNKLFRNGQLVDEKYVHWTTMDPFDNTKFRDLQENERFAVPLLSFKLIDWKGQVIPVSYGDGQVNNHAASIFQPSNTSMGAEEAREMLNAPAVAVPPGKVLFMGDNRLYSDDGRFWGLADRSRVIGRAEFIFMPLNRIGRTW